MGWRAWWLAAALACGPSVDDPTAGEDGSASSGASTSGASSSGASSSASTSSGGEVSTDVAVDCTPYADEGGARRRAGDDPLRQRR